MNSVNTNSPNFGMKLKGLERPYFSNVPKSMINELKAKAMLAPNTNYTIEFIPTKDEFVFCKKIIDDKEYMVEYFPKGYSPFDVIRTFTKAILPEYRVMGKEFRAETNRTMSEILYSKHCN